MKELLYQLHRNSLPGDLFPFKRRLYPSRALLFREIPTERGQVRFTPFGFRIVKPGLHAPIPFRLESDPPPVGCRYDPRPPACGGSRRHRCAGLSGSREA